MAWRLAAVDPRPHPDPLKTCSQNGHRDWVPGPVLKRGGKKGVKIKIFGPVPLKGPRGPLKGPRVPLKGPRGPLKGTRDPLKGPRGPLKGPRVPLKGPRGPLKGTRGPF